jgi:hypothetical protein
VQARRMPAFLNCLKGLILLAGQSCCVHYDSPAKTDNASFVLTSWVPWHPNPQGYVVLSLRSIALTASFIMATE